MISHTLHSILFLTFFALSTSFILYPKLKWCPRNSCIQLNMVRNVDLPEAVIFYRLETLIEEDDNSKEIRQGLKPLLEECKQEGTAVILIDDKSKETGVVDDVDASSNGSVCLPSDVKDLIGFVCEEIQHPPNPRSLYEAIHSIKIEPRGFGGSSGFGRAIAEPERNPLPKHVVVFCSDIDSCRAARYMGMRCISLQDNDLADAIIDDYTGIWLDEIATPGSYWLNPPHPKDDDGNKVEPLELIEWYENEGQEQQNQEELQPQQLNEELAGDLSDSEMARILADLDPL